MNTVFAQQYLTIELTDTKYCAQDRNYMKLVAAELQRYEFVVRSRRTHYARFSNRMSRLAILWLLVITSSSLGSMILFSESVSISVALLGVALAALGGIVLSLYSTDAIFKNHIKNPPQVFFVWNDTMRQARADATPSTRQLIDYLVS